MRKPWWANVRSMVTGELPCYFSSRNLRIYITLYNNVLKRTKCPRKIKMDWLFKSICFFFMGQIWVNIYRNISILIKKLHFLSLVTRTQSLFLGKTPKKQNIQQKCTTKNIYYIYNNEIVFLWNRSGNFCQVIFRFTTGNYIWRFADEL